MGFYLKRKASRDTPADVEERRRFAAAVAQMKVERDARWPQITPENVDEVVRWQDERIDELRKLEAAGKFGL